MQFLIYKHHKIIFLLWVAITSLIGNSIAQENTVLPDTITYSFLNKELNYLQFYNRSALSHFVQKWTRHDGTITIAHLGDSHLQSDIFPGELRRNLQNVKGYGGRGMVFPFSMAKTYSANDLKSFYTGQWQCSRSVEHYPKLPLGASGATCRTIDPNASFTLTFKNDALQRNKFLRIYCKKTENSFDLIVRTGERRTVVLVDSFTKDCPYMEVEIPEGSENTITIQMLKHHNYETEFELYGVSLETGTNSGLMLHCLGIGGAMYSSVVREELFQDHFPSLNADLVIIDFGTNDILYTDKVPDDMETQIKNVIAKVRFSAPKASILLTSTQDMYRKGKNIRSAEQFADLIRKVAKDENCAFYDWYWISGGPRAMTTWQRKQLALPDMIHLSPPGYRLKGTLLTEAFLNTLHTIQTSKPESLLLQVDSLKSKARAEELTLPPDPVPTVKKTTAPSGYMIIYHRIKPGETISTIAQKYHVSQNSIITLNQLQTSKIVAGKTLKIKVKAR
jgi:LysM repeat protein